MLRKTILAVGALSALAAPALFTSAATAAPSSWYVVQDSGSGTCNVIDTAPAIGENKLGGPFASLALANSAMAGFTACADNVQSIDE